MATMGSVPAGGVAAVRGEGRDWSAAVLRGAGLALVATVWLSMLLFGAYVLVFYAGAFADGQMADWNHVLPRLYDRTEAAATAGIGLHFFTGAIVLLAGCIQLIGKIRDRYPALHRWIGRVYVASCFLAGVGGLVFISALGTIGGTVMDLGFGLYGVLTIVAAVQTYRHARAGELEAHRAWALRLFALAIGSWLFRMDYGFWMILMDGLGHAQDFRGPFDQVMAFFFYLPNLAVAEAFTRARRLTASPALRLATASVLAGASLFLLVGTYYFSKFYWFPLMLHRLAG